LFHQIEQNTFSILKIKTMKKTNIFYWIFTGLFSALMLGSAIPDIMIDPIAVQGMHTELGYPTYFIPFIGVAKALGVIALLIPGYPKIKEWAYAGLIFDLIGATYSIFAIGKSDAAFMVLPLALGITSSVFYQKRRKMQSTRTAVRTEAFAGAVLQ
jgi:hypothetical protein